MTVDCPPRVLIADDQPDVLEALRLLLKGEGYRIESASSPATVIDAVQARDFDAVLMDLNYARDTTSGEEGLDLLTRLQRAGCDAARHRDDRLGQRRHRRRSDAAGRPRLRPEAVGQRARAGHRPHAGRTVAGAAPAAAPRSREPLPEARRRTAPHRRGGGDAAGARDRSARRPVRRQRADHRRERHRQGDGRAGDPRRVAARGPRAWSRSTPRACRRECSKASSSAT